VVSSASKDPASIQEIAMGRVTARRTVVTFKGDDARSRSDRLAVEEPLEIRVDGERFSVTMRTPGSDFELAHGFLVSEGVIWRRDQVTAIRYCAGRDDDDANTYNVLDVGLRDANLDALEAMRRQTYTSSSCGICGKASLDAVTTTTRHTPASDDTRFDRAVVVSLPDRLREAQRVFDQTGGLHAAGLFDAAGNALVVREDVGRHNAVDKVVGWALENDLLPLRGIALCVSGRASFELVQKAAMAGVPLLAAVSAPSSLAADLAHESGISLAGFVRGDSMNVYARPDRILN
jgi:FdhD protein